MKNTMRTTQMEQIEQNGQSPWTLECEYEIGNRAVFISKRFAVADVVAFCCCCVVVDIEHFRLAAMSRLPH